MKQIEDLRTSLSDGLIAPQEIIGNDDLTADEKVSLLLTSESLTDVGYRLLTLNLVEFLRRDFCVKPHDFGLHMNTLMKLSMDKIEAYANHEMTGRELVRFLKQHKISSFAGDDIEPADIAATCISLYHFVSGESAANDLLIFEEPEVDTKAYVDATADYTMGVILDALRLTYQQMLH